ncbi:trypsin-like serine peptidase [Nocardia sp. NPDC057353]|uniref:trypsin-like serine peptidase n=1 Tax=Nocardia sp. NPDC057353 TaxID=3346104 RepID=UPI0036396A8F
MTTIDSAPGRLLERTEIPSDIRRLVHAIPGQAQHAVDPAAALAGGAATTTPYRPPWATYAEPAVAETFTLDGQVFAEPLVHEEPNPMLYPMCTVGIVLNGDGSRASGVLVGPNLMLTAGHVAPWGASSWSMEFVPAFRLGDRPFGSSFVQSYWGFNPGGNGPTGYDYVICKLFNPLGTVLGWMGSQSWGDEDEYSRHRYVSSGYPGTFGGRPAVELNMGIRDIDDDSPGKELEFALRPDLGPGWSGGPLWVHTPNPFVVGVCSGQEKDGLDPTRVVFAGGRGMVDVIQHGLTHMRP